MDYSRIITTTAQRLAPYVVDGFHGSSVLAGKVLARPVAWTQGQYHRVPLQYAESDTGGAFVGLGDFDTSAVSVDVNQQWQAKGDYQNVTLVLADIAHNQTEAGVINLVKRQMDIAKNAGIARLGSTFYGLGLGNAMDGLRLQADDSTLTSSYAGLSRTTYGDVINGQLTPAAGGKISLQTMGAQVDLCSAASSTNEATNLEITTKTIWGLVETLLEAKSRINFDTSRGYLRVSPYTPMGTAVDAAELGGVAGFEAIFHRGIPLVKDDQCPSGYFFTLNERYMKFVRLDLPELNAISMAQQVTKGVYDENPKPTAFQMTDFRMPTNQLGKVGQVVLYGNFINEQTRRTGAITGVTGI